MKRTLYMFLILLAAWIPPQRAQAQSLTAVSATVTDPNGIPYANASVKATLAPPGQGAPCVVTGGNCVPISGSVGPVPMSSAGSFTMNVYPNSEILCGGQSCSTQWTFTVSITPGALPPLGTGPQSFSATVTVSGSSQSITSALEAVPPPDLGTFTPGGSPVDAPQGSLFYMQESCAASATNCLQLVDDDSTDNCGTALTTFLATINSQAGPGAPTLAIYGGSAGTGQAFKFSSCDLEFTRSLNIIGAATIDCGQSSGDCWQIGPTGNTGYNLTYNATSAASVHTYITGHFTWIGGAGLTTGGIFVPPWQAYVQIRNQHFVNFGPGNATSGNCTAWAVEILSLNNGLVADNEWLSWDSTAGRCAFENVESGSVSGQASVNFQHNALMAGGGPPCSSQGIYTAGNFWNISNNMIAGFGVDVRIGANNGDYGGAIENNFFGNSCAAKSTTGYIWFGQNGESGEVAKDVEIIGNDFQGNSGYAIVVAPDTSDTADYVDFSRNIVTHGTMTVAPSGFTCASGSCFQDGLINYQGGELSASTASGWDQPSHRLGTVRQTGQTANLSATTILNSSFGGSGNAAAFNVGCYTVVSNTPTGGTLPSCVVTYTSFVTGTTVSNTITPTAASSAEGTTQSAMVMIQAKAGNVIQISTTGYAAGSGTALAYTVMATIARTP